MLSVNNSFKKFILFYVRHWGQLSHVKSILRELNDCHFIISSHSIDEKDFYKHEVSRLDNAIWVDDHDLIISKISSFDILMTFDSLLVKGHKACLNVIEEARKFDLPIMELQHGLFQVSINAFHQPTVNKFFDESLVVRSAATHRLTWFETPDGINIGYPIFDGRTIPRPQNFSKPIVSIFTNLHWKARSRGNRVKILFDILNFIKNHPNIYFFWKRHHGELCDIDTIEDVNNVENLIGQQMTEFDNLVLVDNETEPSRLLEFSTHAISTISTVLLDIEMYHVECAVIADEETINLLDVFDTFTIFNSDMSLDNFKELRSGMLFPFNPKILRKTVMEPNGRRDLA